MMVLYINGRFLTQKITGEQRYAIGIVKEMDLALEKEENKGKSIVILLPNEAVVSELNLKHIKTQKIGKLKGHAWVQLDLPSYVKKHGGALLTLAGLAPVFAPGYWTVHDITFKRYPESFSPRFRLAYSAAYRMGLSRAKRIFTVSEFSKKEISAFYKIDPEKISVAYTSANYLFARENKEVDRAQSEEILKTLGIEGRFFLSVGSRNLHKNQKYVKALAALYPEKTFVIAGGINKSFNASDEENSLKNLIYTDYVSDKELSALYANADGFIFPSFYEGFGLPPLEAIAQKCQRVALSDIPVFRKLYDRGAYFFDPADAKSFIMEDFMNTRVSENDRAYYLRKYSFKKSAAQYLALIVQGKDLTGWSCMGKIIETFSWQKTK